MPDVIEPMLCTRSDKPFDGEDWIFELKWDGYRIVTFKNKAVIKLQSRNDQNYTSRYPIIVKEIKKLKHNVVIDGEVVALNEEGKPDFSLLQNYKSDVTLQYYVFDLLWIDGFDLMSEPLIERKKLLQSILPTNETLHFLDHVEEKGREFFELVKHQKLEGIVAKKKDSYYFPNSRSKSWIKIPIQKMQEYVIVGYTDSEHGRPFSRLMFGEYINGKLNYVHHTGGGISDSLLYSTYKRLKPLEVKNKTVENNPEEETPIHWVKPLLVGQFKLKELAETKAGHKRHPVIFLGIREDKVPEEIIAEGEEVKVSKSKKNKTFNVEEVWKSIHHEKVTHVDEITVEKHKLKIINPDKEYWMGIPKAQILVYYQSIAKYILPYIKDRPLGLNVITTWAGGDNIFMRNMKGYYPDWVKTFNTARKVKKTDKSEDIDWVICNDLATLLYLINLGALDLHPWSARTQSYKKPDYLVIDLDPPKREKGKTKEEENKIEKAKEKDLRNLIKTAQAAKSFFDKQGLVSFIKTSGKRGLHILLPCENILYEQTRYLVEEFNKQIHKTVPTISTVEASTTHPERAKKIYIDASQNDYADRLAAAYSVRAYKIPTISTPLDWDEVNDSLNPKDFKIDTIMERVQQYGDLFKEISNSKIKLDNTKIIKQKFLG